MLPPSDSESDNESGDENELNTIKNQNRKNLFSNSNKLST